MQNSCYFVNEITSLFDKGNCSFNGHKHPTALELATHNEQINLIRKRIPLKNNPVSAFPSKPRSSLGGFSAGSITWVNSPCEDASTEAEKAEDGPSRREGKTPQSRESDEVAATFQKESLETGERTENLRRRAKPFLPELRTSHEASA